jgi:hypothetical protein
VAGGAAGAALVLLRARKRTQTSAPGLVGMRDTAERTIRDLEREARKLLGER